jgi:hypothetical protein
VKYRKKPVLIDAWQWQGQPRNEWPIWLQTAKHVQLVEAEFRLKISTLEGTMRANLGDWVLKGITGELYPCNEDIFFATYEMVSEE